MLPRTAANWYSRLASLTRAGITIPEALRMPGGPGKAFGRNLADRMENGEDTRDVWAGARARLGRSDAILLAAGQLSGRFPDVCAELAERHATRDRIIRKMISAAAYPLLMMHVIAVMSPFAGAFTSGCDVAAQAVSAGWQSVINLVVIWAVIIGAFLLANKRPSIFAALVRPLPLWGSCIRNAALANFAGTLVSLLRAGVHIGEAWKFAGEASGDTRIEAASLKIVAVVESRRPPGPELASLGVFPDEFCVLYHTGERTGQLEQHLDKLRVLHDDVSLARATTASTLYPIFLYGVIVAIAVGRVLGFWSGYANRLNDSINSIQ